jgi:heptaprenyl diphosphate synthase
MTSDNLDDNKISSRTKNIVLTGILFAVAIVLSIIENLIQFPVIAPGVKLGLSNIVVMFTLFFLGKQKAFLLAFLKAMFVFITRGTVAGILSLCGGLLSITVMSIILIIFKDKVSYLMISIAGSVFHNLGQLAAVSILYTNIILWVYLPVFLLTGIVTGIATSALLKVCLTAFKKLFAIKKFF